MPRHPIEKKPSGKSVLFVCTGNICRSPTAEAVFRLAATRAGIAVHADSCGTQGYHVGEPPDPRAQRHAARRGYDLSALRARRIADADFETFDMILACDRGHYEALLARAAAHAHGKIRMLRADGGDILDPYYDGPESFETVLDQIEAECTRLVAELGTDHRVT